MQLQPHVGLVLSEDLDAVDVAEVGQQGHQVGAGVDDVADAVTGPHQQRHVRLLLALLGGSQRWDGEGLRFKEDEEVQDTGGWGAAGNESLSPAAPTGTPCRRRAATR